MINLTITQAKKALKEKQFSAVELMQAHLNRIEKDDPNINAFITVTKEKALADAKKADELLSQGVDKPLLGIPYSLKDIFSCNFFSNVQIELHFKLEHPSISVLERIF